MNVDLAEGPGSQAAHSLGSSGGPAQQEPGSSPFRLLSAFLLPRISPQSVPAKEAEEVIKQTAWGQARVVAFRAGGPVTS